MWFSWTRRASSGISPPKQKPQQGSPDCAVLEEECQQRSGSDSMSLGAGGHVDL